MIVDVSTHLAAPIELIRDHVERTRLLRHVAWPLVIFASREPDGFPERWRPGPHRVWMWLFGFLPMGPQTIGIEIGPVSERTYSLRDNGSGLLARVWDHVVTLRAEGEATHYTDHVRIKAGLLTPLVWGFAMIFYRWRQARWRALVRRGFRY